MFVFTYTCAVFAIICWVYAGAIVYRRARQPLVILLSTLIFFAGLWAFANSFADISVTGPTILFWSGAALLAYMFFTACFFHFVFNFVRQWKSLSKWWLVIIYSASGVISILAFTPLSYKNPLALYSSPAIVEVGPVIMVSTIVAHLIFAAAYFLLLKNYHSMPAQSRSQSVYIIAGSFGTIVGAVIFTVILPILGNPNFYSIGPVFNLFLIAGVSYAIFRHKLLDVKVIIQKSLIYTGLLGLIIAFYLALIYAGLYFSGSSESKSIYLVASLCAALAGIFGAPKLERFFGKITDRIFFKDTYDYPKALHTLSESLNRNLELSALMQDTADALRGIFKIQRLGILIPQPLRLFRNGLWTEVPDSREIELIVGALQGQPQIIFYEDLAPKLADKSLDPDQKKGFLLLFKVFNNLGYKLMASFSTPEKIIGFLALSPKMSGDKFTAQDIQLVKTFCHQAAVAIEKSLLYDQIKKHAVDLEAQVAARTGQLQKLQEDQKQIMIDISHSLQTPLTVMKIRLDSLKKQTGYNEEFKTLEKTVDEISKRTYDLLWLARLETQDEKFNFQRLELSNLLLELTEYAAVMCQAAGITLRSNIRPGIFIKGDRQRLEEMVNNIVSNAIKYIANQKVITIELKAAGSQAEILIEDSGLGIAPESLPHIFKRFYRGKARGDFSVGFGVGLAIANKIVEKHNGSISVVSALDKGSSFVVKLPLI